MLRYGEVGEDDIDGGSEGACGSECQVEVNSGGPDSKWLQLEVGLEY